MRRARPARNRAAAVAAVGSMLALAACGHATVRADRTSEFVVENVRRQTGFTPAEVQCPSGIEAVVGVEFDCRFLGPTGPYLAHLKIERVEGEHVTYEYGIKPVA